MSQISDLKFHKTYVCKEERHALSKALDTSSATPQLALDLIKAIASPSDTSVRRSAVYREDLKPYWKSAKGHISPGGQQAYYLQVFQRLH